MTVPSLFDMPPLARSTDPITSHLAGVVAKRSRKELVQHIRAALDRFGPLTHVEIAERVEQSQPHRWHSTTIISACASAYLHEWDHIVNERGRLITVWSLIPNDIETVQLAGDEL